MAEMLPKVARRGAPPTAPRASSVLPSIDDLRCFAAASRLLNFRAAARAVALTPAALGQRIRKLEEELGAPLFRRTTRSVSLTEAGLALVPFAERCLASARDCVRAARGETGPAPAQITLGTRQELGMSWIVPQLEGLGRRFPSLDLHLYFGSGRDLLLRLRTLEIDCAVTSSRFGDPLLDAIPLHREDYVFVGSSALLRRRPLTTAAQAKEHTLLDESGDLPLYRYFRDARGGPERLAFGRIVRLGGIAAIRERVTEGAGVAVLPEYLVAPDLARGGLRRVFPRAPLLHDYFRLVFRVDDVRRPIFESLAESMLATPLG
jgi:DNA-binding transcriptional LysR family regulator